MKKKSKVKGEKEKTITAFMEKLAISREEAEELWAFDHDEIDCPEVDAMESAAKEKAKPKGSSLDKVKNLKAKQKGDSEKSGILDAILGFLGNCERVINPQQITATKMSFKGENGGWYTVTVTKHKSKPDGYKE